ncbi:EamA family transporter [Arthrobacter tumbae]|uniref:EamA family transporter n=1 Tax=Arthrobacter tumbae TaxID=163874 RepID=UPI00195A760B|nr:EamA family transporter [Arthrobacter tumbae]MBM7782167.1 putative blue pigment (indigoidine) exporter [Arthrobacter tumbae]
MLSKTGRTLLVTALAPMVWGSTYLVTVTLLPPGLPLTAAVLRALPAGLLLLLVVRRLPRGSWWWKALVLGGLNIGVFFALLFVAAYRLPGGVAATVGAVQPLIVAGLATWVLKDRLSLKVVFAGITGAAGVALLVLSSQARLDTVGVLAALGGAVSMATGVVLAKKWGKAEKPLTMTAWQLVAGGLLLVPLMFIVEGVPPELSAGNVSGYLYLSLVGTAVAYVLWFRGIQRLPVTAPSFLGLLSPVVAALLGWLVMGEQLALLQGVGGLLVLGSILAVTVRRRSGRQPAVAVPAVGESPEIRIPTPLR